MPAVSKQELINAVGTTLEPGEWFEMTQERVNQFADTTLDHQFIHIDAEKAAQTPFGGTIAHGFLSLSMLVHLTAERTLYPDNILMGINYGFDKVRFLTPVRTGKRVRALVTIKSVEEKEGNRLLVNLGCAVEIEGEDKPALVADWLNMYMLG